MGFLKWMEGLPKWAKVLISLVAGWRAYEIVKAIVYKKTLVGPIILAVFAWIFDWIDFFFMIFKNHHFIVE